jgi:hypothetical protein
MEKGEGDTCQADGDGEQRKMMEGEAGAGVRGVVRWGRTLGVMLPCIDEEAVEAAEGGE